AVVLTAAVSAAYFIYMWVNMRATMGMRLLGMQIGHESDGRTITYQQAALRFAVMWGPYYLAGLLAAFALGLALLTYLVAIAWGIVLIVTTAQSPTKQGLHDKYAQTMVVKAARAAG
ncbi:MAG: RDD family protein, partial [Candidatus Limnocylindrales bacterium]